MLQLVLRLAMLGGAVLVLWNVTMTFARALRAPKKVLLPKGEARELIAARDMCEAAQRKMTAFEMDIAKLDDAELWAATEALSAAVARLIASVMAEPSKYRRARRHLGQILFGAELTARHFARLHAVSPNNAERGKFLELLVELAEAYDKAATDYAASGYADLEIEQQVLRDLIDRAGKH